jgi:hypothetical protein
MAVVAEEKNARARQVFTETDVVFIWSTFDSLQ